jgi:hypothetical protein
MTKSLQLLFILVLLISFLTTNAQYSVRIIKTGEDAGVDVSYDDGEYENDAIDKLYDDDLDMGWEGDDFNVMTTFLRFQNVQIPQGVTIDSAFLRIYAHEDEADEARVTIFAEATDHSVIFNDSELISARVWGTDSIKWDITQAWTMWQPYKSVNISSVIQGVVNRSGWVSGNALTIFLRGENQGASLLDNARDFESFENIEDPSDGGDGLHHPERIPELVVYGTFTGINQSQSVSNQLSIYPNPSNNGIFHLTLENGGQSEINIYDFAGKLVLATSSNKPTTQIDLRNFNNGIYFIQVVNNENTSTQKIIINK